MKFKLGTLPKLVLSEVFWYVDADELFNLRFLNKYIFNVTQDIINDYLCYSTYPHKDDPLNKVQHDFIKKNPSEIKHLTIMSGELPDYLRVDENIRMITDMDGNSYLNNDICDKYTNLKSICIHLEWYKKGDELELTLNYFRKLLFKVDGLNINTIYPVDLDLVLSLLNPNKLKVLKIEDVGYKLKIRLSDISKFSRFKYLECLEIDASYFTIGSNHQSNSNTVIFPALKSLKLHGCFGFDLEIFSNISNLETLHLCEKKRNLENLGYLREKLTSKIYLDCFIDTTQLGWFDFNFDDLNFISTLASITSLLLRGARDTKDEGKFIDMPAYLNIEEITFHDNDININYIFNMLECFPNIKKVTFKDGQLYTYSNTPLRLPNNPKSFLFCIEMKYTEFNDKHTILSLLETVPTYMY